MNELVQQWYLAQFQTSRAEYMERVVAYIKMPGFGSIDNAPGVLTK